LILVLVGRKIALPAEKSKRLTPPMHGRDAMKLEEPAVEPRLPQLLLVLTAVTGFVDAVSYLGLGRVFTANMTGNVVLLAFALVGTPGLSIQRSLVALAAFLFGAIVGGRNSLIGGSLDRKTWMGAAFRAETALLMTATLAAVGYRSDQGASSIQLYAIIILTAVAMGMRNATVRRLGVADLTTTVLTLTVTGLAADSSLAGGSNPNLFRRIGSVVMMFGGAALGALMLRHSLTLPLAVCTGVSAGCTASVTFGGTSTTQNSHSAEGDHKP
jgi:uncharacterized membrane protein YoaK (UPF0700 family)